MIELLSRWFETFAFETGILGQIRQYQNVGSWVLLALAFGTCFLGFRVYRGLFSISLFFAVAYGSCVYLSNFADWGVVVTCFAVAGTALAVLGYGWYRLGGFFLCGLMLAMMGLAVGAHWWLVIGMALVAGLLELAFPVITICVCTSLWGGILLGEASRMFLHAEGILPIVYGVAGVVLGCALQILWNRKQKLFTKTCPDKIRYRLEQRRKNA